MKDKALKKKGNLLKSFEPLLWLAPCLILMGVFILYPVVNVIYSSFCDIGRSGLIKSVGTLDNYREVFANPVFGRVIINTFVWTIAIVAISTFFAVILALVLNTKFVGVKIARAVLVIPWGTSLMVFACAWKYIFDYNYGYLNSLFEKLGWAAKPINWLGGSPWGAFACLIFVGIIVTVPFMTFTLLSGLQSISNDYYEAATIDGANGWQKFWKITFPLLRPSLNVSTVLNIIYVFNSFAIVHNITAGAPAHQTDTIMTFMYSAAFSAHSYGEANAISVVSFVILMIISYLYLKLLMKEDE